MESRLAAAIGQINGSSERIAKIVKVIDEIAFQTNIFTLNAQARRLEPAAAFPLDEDFKEF